jgi:hypothetical protein
LGHTFGDVEEDNVAKLFKSDEVGQRAADLARAYQCDLTSRHQITSLIGEMAPVSGVISRFGWRVQVGRKRRCAPP